MTEERRKENQGCSHEDLREEIRQVRLSQEVNDEATSQMHRAMFGDEVTREKGLIDKFDDLKEDMKPLIEAFTDNQGFWKTVGNYAKYVGWGAAILVAIKLLGGDIIKIFSK